jgi:hypothetical protein
LHRLCRLVWLADVSASSSRTASALLARRAASSAKRHPRRSLSGPSTKLGFGELGVAHEAVLVFDCREQPAWCGKQRTGGFLQDSETPARDSHLRSFTPPRRTQ